MDIKKDYISISTMAQRTHLNPFEGLEFISSNLFQF